MKKIVFLLVLVAWAYQNPNHFVLFWGGTFGKTLNLLFEIFTLALKIFQESQGGTE